jgi:hypothetical protein
MRTGNVEGIGRAAVTLCAGLAAAGCGTGAGADADVVAAGDVAADASQDLQLLLHTLPPWVA